MSRQWTEHFRGQSLASIEFLDNIADFEKQYYEILERICKVFHLKFESLAILML